MIEAAARTHLRTMSFQNQRRVPFTIPQAADVAGEGLVLDMSGSMVVSGLLGLEGDTLVIQVRENPMPPSGSLGLGGLEGLFGMGGSEGRRPGSDTDKPRVVEAEIPLEELASAHIKGRWGRTILLSTNDLNHFTEVPGARGDRLTLKVARKHRLEADRLVHDLQMRLSDLGIAHLDRQIARLEGGDTDGARDGAGRHRSFPGKDPTGETE